MEFGFASEADDSGHETKNADTHRTWPWDEILAANPADNQPEPERAEARVSASSLLENDQEAAVKAIDEAVSVDDLADSGEVNAIVGTLEAAEPAGADPQMVNTPSSLVPETFEVHDAPDEGGAAEVADDPVEEASSVTEARVDDDASGAGEESAEPMESLLESSVELDDRSGADRSDEKAVEEWVDVDDGEVEVAELPVLVIEASDDDLREGAGLTGLDDGVLNRGPELSGALVAAINRIGDREVAATCVINKLPDALVVGADEKLSGADWVSLSESAKAAETAEPISRISVRMRRPAIDEVVAPLRAAARAEAEPPSPDEWRPLFGPARPAEAAEPERGSPVRMERGSVGEPMVEAHVPHTDDLLVAMRTSLVNEAVYRLDSMFFPAGSGETTGTDVLAVLVRMEFDAQWFTAKLIKMAVTAFAHSAGFGPLSHVVGEFVGVLYRQLNPTEEWKVRTVRATQTADLTADVVGGHGDSPVAHSSLVEKAQTQAARAVKPDPRRRRSS